MTTPEALLQLQLTDSAIDLIRNRMTKLPAVVASDAAAAAVAAMERQAAAIQRRIADFETAIAESEAANATITAQRTRLEQQLKTVIAPREAEALMHEIELLRARRSDLDDAELEAMEGMGAAEDELATLRSGEGDLRAAALEAAGLADEATAAAEAESISHSQAREVMRAALDPELLRRYDTMRGQHNGIAVAKLNGLQCDGCHLDISRAEVDDLKRLPPDEFGECPNCGRMLVR